MVNYTPAPNMTPSPNMTPMSWWMFTPAPMAQKPKVNLFDFDKPAPFAWWLPQMQQRIPKITATPQQLQRGGEIIEKEKEVKNLTGMWSTEYDKVKSEKKLSYQQAQKFAKANGISVQEAVKWFAEKGYSVGRQWLGSYMKESFQEVAAPAVWLAVWVSDVWQKTVGKWVELATKGIVKAFWGDPSRVNTQTNTEFMGNVLGDKAESGRAKFGREIWRIAGSTALTAPIGGLWAIKTAWNIVKTGKTLSKLQKAWQIGKQMGIGAAEGIAWNTAYNISAWQHPLQHVGTAGLLGAAIPWASAWVAAIRKWLGKTAEATAVRWLLNVSDARRVKDILKETADGEVAIGRWALERWIVGKNTKDALEILDTIKKTNYKKVRDVVWWVKQRYKDVDSVEWGLQMVLEEWKAINAKWWGRQIVNLQEIQDIMFRNKTWQMSLSDVQRTKELMDDFVGTYSKSGDPLNTKVAIAGRDLRDKTKVFLENEVSRATGWKVNLRELNREVSVASALSRWIDKKSVANELKQHVIEGSLWGVWAAWIWWVSALSNPIWYVSNFIAGSILWRAVWKTIWNPVVMWKVAKLFDKMSDGTRKEILEYVKEWAKTQLSQEAIEQLVRVKEEASRIPEISTAMRLVKEGKLKKWFTVPQDSLIGGKVWALKAPGSTNTLKEINLPPKMPQNNFTKAPQKSIIKNIDGFKDVVWTYKSKSDFIKDFKKMWQWDPFQEWKMKSFAIDKALISNKLDTKYKWYKSIDDALSAMYDDMKTLPKKDVQMDSLYQEAKKYKSADDFVKWQKVLYRWWKWESKYYTSDKNVATDYAKYRWWAVSEYVLPKWSKKIDYNDIPWVKFKGINDYEVGKYALNKKKTILDFMEKDLEKDYTAATKRAKKNWYDIITFPTEWEVRAINDNIVKNKSQLGKIREEANKR